MEMAGDKTYEKILNEVNQLPSLRQPLYMAIEKELEGKAVISLYTSYMVMIEDNDAGMIQEVLQHSDTKHGLVLIINSLGGSGLAAERIIKICRNYSGNNFEVIIPFQAKSAATMICLGAKKIFMSSTSELGPIDPQTTITVEGERQLISAGWIIKTYDELFQNAIACEGHIEPYIQQLTKYDPRKIEEFRSMVKLSEDIAISSLKTGMMKSLTKAQIKQKIKSFCEPGKTLAHGRPIFADQAKNCGLSIEIIDINSSLWKHIWELHLRLQYQTNRNLSKIVESKGESYQAANPFVKEGMTDGQTN